MATYEIFYTTRQERTDAIDLAEGQGHTLEHDDFDQGLLGEHRLTFEDSPPVRPPPTAEEIELAALKTSLKSTPRVADLARFLELTGQLD